MCGCAAGKARPGIALALGDGPRPDHLGTVFAGGDIEATERAREHFEPYPPSSPSLALLKDGKLVLHDGAPRHREPASGRDRPSGFRPLRRSSAVSRVGSRIARAVGRRTSRSRTSDTGEPTTR